MPGGAPRSPAPSSGTRSFDTDTCPGPPRACPQPRSNIKQEPSPGAGNRVKCHLHWAVSGCWTTTVISCREAANKPTPSSALPPLLCFPRGTRAAEPRGSPRSLSSPSAQPSALPQVSHRLSLPARIRPSPLPLDSLRTCSLARVGGRGASGRGAPALGAGSPLLHGFGSGWVTAVCRRADALAGDAWLRCSLARQAPSAVEMPQQHSTLLWLSWGNSWSCELFQRHEAGWGPWRLRRADAAVLGLELSLLGQ